MTKFLNGAKLIVKNAKKYFLTFFLVILIMIFATYLNVKAPKLLGESYNALGEYIGISIGINTKKDIDMILEQDVISDEDKQTIATKMKLDDQQTQQLLQMDSMQIKQRVQMQEDINNIIRIDPQYIIDNQTLSQEQLLSLNESNNPMLIGFFMQTDGQQLVQLANNYDQLSNLDQMQKEKHVAFINIIVKLLLAYLFLSAGMVLYTVLFVNVTVNTSKQIRNKLFQKIEQLSIRFYDMSNTGDLLSRFTNDIENITMFLNSSFIQILAALFMIGGLSIMMWQEDNSTLTIMNFTIYKPLFWLIISFGLLALLVSTTILKKAQKYVSQQQNKLGALNGFIDETLSGQKEVISYNLKDKVLKDFDKYNNDFKTNAFKGQIYSGLLMPIMMGMGFVALGIIVFTGSELVIQAIFSVGLLVTFITYSQQFFSQLSSTVAQYNMVELGISGANRVQEIMDEKEEIVNPKNPKDFTNPRSVIEFEHVNFEYIKDKPVLKDINFSVKPGEMIAIVGPTGSGKTTIMNLLNRFYDVSSGKITIDNIDIRDYDLSQLRKNIGIVLQDSVLFKGTIFDNVSFGKNDATKEEVIQACKIAHIHDYIMSLDDGYDTKINNNSSVFSTGQKQLLSIARTILTNPDILILDEATSNVDTITEANIQKAMDSVIKGRTSFVIAHRLKTILKADRILVLKDGEIIESGNHQSLLDQDGFYAALYKNQFVL